MVTKRMPALVLGLVTALLAVGWGDLARAQRALDPVEATVQGHLQWLDRYRNYRAQVTVREGEVTRTGTLLVDNLSGKKLYMEAHPNLPQGVLLKTASHGDLGLRVFLSRGFDRGDDLLIYEGELPATVFSGGVSDLFRRGEGLDPAMARLNEMAETIEVLPASERGARGLDMKLRKGIVERMTSYFDEYLTEDAPEVPRVGRLILWYADDGALSAVDIVGRQRSFSLTVTLAYEARDLPAAEVVSEFRRAASATLAQSPEGQAGPPGGEIAEGLLSSRLILVLSALLVVIAIVVVWRLRTGDES